MKKMEENTKNKLLVSSVILLVLACVSWGFMRAGMVSWTKRQKVTDMQVSKAREGYYKKLHRYQVEVEEDSSKSGDTNLRALSLQNGSEAQISAIGTRLFNLMYNWSNSKEYRQNSEKLKTITSNDVYDKNKLAANESSIQEIDDLGQSSEFDDAKFYIEKSDKNSVTALAKVTFSGGYSGVSKGTVSRVYEMTYDKNNKKITQLNLVQRGGNKF